MRDINYYINPHIPLQVVMERERELMRLEGKSTFCFVWVKENFIVKVEGSKRESYSTLSANIPRGRSLWDLLSAMT